MAYERILLKKVTEAPLAPEVAVIMRGDIINYSEEVLNPGEVSITVEKVNFCIAHVPTAVKRVPRSFVTVEKPVYVDRDVELLFDLRKVDWRYGLIDCIEPCLAKSASKYRDCRLACRLRLYGKRAASTEYPKQRSSLFLTLTIASFFARNLGSFW